MLKFKGEVFSSDGSYAVQREEGTDVAHVVRIPFFETDAEDGLENNNGWRSTDEEYQTILDRIHAALAGVPEGVRDTLLTALDYYEDDRYEIDKADGKEEDERGVGEQVEAARAWLNTI